MQDAQSVAWLERTLAAFKGTVVAVTHDRYPSCPPRSFPGKPLIDILSGIILWEQKICRALLSADRLLCWLMQHSRTSSYYIIASVSALPGCRFFLDNVAGWILELDRGQGIPFEGNYSEWLESRARRMEGERKQQAGLQRAIDAELEFVRSKAKGQQKKGKARMRRYDELVSKVGSLDQKFRDVLFKFAFEPS